MLFSKFRETTEEQERKLFSLYGLKSSMSSVVFFLIIVKFVSPYKNLFIVSI